MTSAISVTSATMDDACPPARAANGFRDCLDGRFIRGDNHGRAITREPKGDRRVYSDEVYCLG
ncbi:hypothetical protein [Acidisoma sp. S159]|uniref:hypothetical protein n=1 Tax=Acidisoma sp. S159 TaxID=1747225 RepID=UPI0020B16595|nr:hypothetical protein [Acidisoma sp. S159]